MKLFDSGEHEGFAPLDLPAKSEGERPASHFGFTAPDGSEWSVLVRRAPVVPVDGSIAAPPCLWLTLASRSEGKTVRVLDRPFVHPHFEIYITEGMIAAGASLQAIIERRVVEQWGKSKVAAAAAPELLAQLDSIGLGGEDA